MELWHKFTSFIMRDVTNDNETKKTSVLIRVYCIGMFVYFLVHVAFFLAHGRFRLLPLPLLGVAGYIVAFILTYYSKTTIARYVLSLNTLFWVLLYIHMLGWNSGFQNFCFMILVFIFMTGYAPLPAKVFVAALVGVVNMALFFYCQNHVSRYLIYRGEMQQFYVLNTVVIFTLLIFLVTMFSLDSLESEKKLIDYNDRMKEMASVDPLTGLSNRRGMEEYIERQLRNTSENQGFINFAIGDIDFFKKVNDTYGHAAGDDLLKQLAALFKDFIKGKGYVARWGGEEFLFMFLGVNGDETQMDLEMLRGKIEKSTFHSGDIELRVTMTFGMEEYNRGDPYEQAISVADEKLYQGKENGRNQVVF